MFTGPRLGAALREAMRLKGVTQQSVAQAFDIKQPSVADWLKHGRVSKKHIPKLVAYFSDAVGPQHWGLPATWASPTDAAPTPDEAATLADLRDVQRINPETYGKLLGELAAIAGGLRSTDALLREGHGVRGYVTTKPLSIGERIAKDGGAAERLRAREMADAGARRAEDIASGRAFLALLKADAEALKEVLATAPNARDLFGRRKNTITPKGAPKRRGTDQLKKGSS